MHKHLAPLSRISGIPPTDAPPVNTGVQRERTKLVMRRLVVKLRMKIAKVFGKVFSLKIPTTKPIISSVGPVTSTVVTAMLITRSSTKGIVIGSSAGGSSSMKPKATIDNSAQKDNGQTKVNEKTKEEKKAKAEVEMEKLTLIQSIMSERAGDSPGMNKGDHGKHYNYEKINAKVAFNHMYTFEKKSKKSYVVSNTDLSQLDFPIKEMMFIMAQYKIKEKFDNDDEYTYVKI